MPSSSKPRHGDPIIEISKDQFGVVVGKPTRQFQEFLDEIDAGVDITTILLEKSESILSAQLLALTKNIQDQIGSGDFLTCDTDSFTCDSDLFTCDMDEA